MRRLFALALFLLAACGSGPGSAPDTGPPSTSANAASVARLAVYPKFGDSDPHDWQGRRPHNYPVHGIDVSRWQGAIDWSRIRREGVSFAYIKATEGGDVLDPKFRDNWRGARRAGVKRGAYHYYYFCRSPEAQARWFIRNVPRDSRALPPVLDMEWNHQSKTCKRRPKGAQVRREAQRFINLIERHYGKTPVIYTTVDFWRDTGIGRLRGAQFWLRSVAGHPREVYPGANWLFWQYTGTGRMAGIAGDVDINVFAGNPEAWLRWASQ